MASNGPAGVRDSEPSLARGSATRVSLYVAAGTAFSVVLWLLVARLVVPPLIESAYREESWGFFNDMLSGRAQHGLELYLAAWRSLAGRIAAVLVTAGAGVLLVARPEVRAALRPRALPENALPPGRGRRAVVLALISTVVLGSLLSIALDREAFPFSPYPMYSGIVREEYDQFRVFGVTEQEEVELSAAGYWRPYGAVHLGLALDRWQADSSRLEAGLSGALLLYESRRRQGLHDGPALRGLRFRRVVWRLHPWAENIDQPERRELVYEFILADE